MNPNFPISPSSHTKAALPSKSPPKIKERVGKDEKSYVRVKKSQNIQTSMENLQKSEKGDNKNSTNLHVNLSLLSKINLPRNDPQSIRMSKNSEMSFSKDSSRNLQFMHGKLHVTDLKAKSLEKVSESIHRGNNNSIKSTKNFGN